MFNLKGPQGQNPRTTRGPRTTVWETLLYWNKTRASVTKMYLLWSRNWILIYNTHYHQS